MIITVDPGLNNLGITAFDSYGKILSSRTIKMTSKETQESRLYKIFETVFEAASGMPVEQIVSEKQFVEIMSVINGSIRAAAGKLGTKTTLFTPTSWKKKATGKGNVSEEDLRAKIISVYPEAKDFDEHRIDTIGIYLAYKIAEEEGHVSKSPKKTKRK